MNREILKLAIPNILTMLSVPLLGSVDLILMGHESSIVFVDAVAVGAIVFSFIYWGFAFLRMGTTGLTAQAFGREDEDDIILILVRGLLVALVGSTILILLRQPIGTLAFSLISGSPDVKAAAHTYYSIRIWDAPATIAQYVFLGWFFGMQRAIFPLVVSILINLVNIGVSILLVHNYGMQVEGVAWGTVIAQYFGLLLVIVIILLNYGGLIKRLHWSTFWNKIKEIEAFKAFWALNRDIFIRTFLLVGAFAFFTDRSSAQGEVILGVNAILEQFILWMAYGVDGFAFAAESLVGKYAGIGNKALLRKSIRTTFKWGMGLAAVYSIVYMLSASSLIELFVGENNVHVGAIRTIAQDYFIWIIIIPILGTPSYIWDGVYVGLTATKAMRDTMLLSVAVYLSVYAIQLYGFGGSNHGLWLAFASFLIARGLFQTVWYWKYLRD